MHPKPRRVSPDGQNLLSAAAQIDHDWSMPTSSEAVLMTALDDLDDEDLYNATLYASHLWEATTRLQVRRSQEGSRL